MQIRAGYELTLEFAAPTAITLLLSVRPERVCDLLTDQTMNTTPRIDVTEHVDAFGNVARRALAPAGLVTFSADFLIHDSGLPDSVSRAAIQHRIEDIPDAVMPYLLGSRYCETDELSDLAWTLFGQTRPGWERVQAIVDYVHERITFNYADARNTRSAREAHEERKGVCRDFAHLAVAFCRCMNIPARYCTGYLGDIGVPTVDAPMDFSAWFEVWLGGRWHTFDARHNARRVGRVLIACGRDATDTAITTTFGSAALRRFKVVTEAAPSDADWSGVNPSARFPNGDVADPRRRRAGFG